MGPKAFDHQGVADAPTEPERVNVFVKFTGSTDNLVALGLRAGPPVESPHDGNLIVAGSIPAERLGDLERAPSVIRVERSQLLRPMLNLAMPVIHADVLRQRNPSIDGTGVLIGIVDSGIDFTHHNFRTGDEFQNSRILEAWDQTQSTNPGSGPPVDRALGRLYTRGQINTALAKEKDDPGAPFRDVGIVDHGDFRTTSHGTGVAGIAAGNGNDRGECPSRADYFGVAPSADLIIVKFLLKKVDYADRFGDTNREIFEFVGDSVNILHGVQYIFARAAAESKPCVVNLSLGSAYGPHDGSSMLEQMLDGMLVTIVNGEPQGVPGRSIVVAAGNHGNDGAHADATIAPGDTKDIVFRVPKVHQLLGTKPVEIGYSRPEEIQIFNDGGDDVEITVSPARGKGQQPLTLGPLPPGQPIQDFPINPTGNPIERIAVRFEQEPKVLKLFLKWAHQLSSGPFPSGAWHIHIKNKSTSRTIRADVWMRGTEHGLRYREVLRNKRIPNDQLSFRFSFEGPNDLTPLSQDRTISTPGWAKYVITVGSFDHRSIGKPGGPAISFSSGRGIPNTPDHPVKPDEFKPDVVACGEAIKAPDVFTNLPQNHTISLKWCSRCCYEFYDVWHGTSFSAPMAAGVVALMMQVKPTIDSLTIRRIIRDKADKPTLTPSLPFPNHIWGYGILNALAAVDEVTASLGGSASAGASATAGSGGSAKSAAPVPARPTGSILPSFSDFARMLRLPEASVATLLVSKHFSEVRRLIDKDRRIALLWHRCRGPRLVRGTLGYLYGGGSRRQRPAVDDGRDKRRLLTFLTALSEQGSVRLRTDLDRFGGELLGVFSRSPDSMDSASSIAAE